MHSTKLTLNLTILLILGMAAAAIVALQSSDRTPSVAVDGLEARGRAPAGTTLEALPVVERLVLPAAEFHPMPGEPFAATLNRASNECLQSTGSTTAASSLQLPDGAQVVASEVSVFDGTAASGDVIFQVDAADQINPAAPAEPSRSIVLQVTSNAEGDGSGWQLLEGTFAFTIDNSTKAYPIEVFLGASGLQFCSAVIEYIPPSSGGLIFHSLPACAVFDTRVGQGGREAPLAPAELTAFDLDLADYSSQGGVVGDCGVPTVADADNPGGTQGVLLNLVALNPTANGNLKAWDIDETEPAGGVLVFEAGSPTNAYVPVGQSDPDSFGDAVTHVANNSSGTTDVRGVVVGYFTAP